MLIHLGYEIAFRLPQPTPMLATLNIHDSRRTDIVIGQELRALPGVPMRQYHDSFGNTCTRLHAPAGLFTLYGDAVVQDSGVQDLTMPQLREVPMDALPDETLIFLLGSRYCETDKLVGMAWDLFGNAPTGWNRVQAICDYVHAQIEFGYHHANATKGAMQALQEGRGVCRDFAHSAIALCRCMNIPARYCTGYLGDIGVAPVAAPMDFSAWFEAYLDGQWYTFDARHNTPRIGRVLIARGRDAADAAISNSFGASTLEKFEVWTEQTDDPTLSPRLPVSATPPTYTPT
ncbi:transglutaminase family protein [Pseudoxanthomonas sp.]|uniref:transglutaminase-like domain-containing protein n=1 Tax=Pseudoxanthomonas sp. TaxID=1871049 RepID=UPI002608B57C|nr:transglutaminase family protein [Pseudoxanthomonas sp.]WDS35872.1 MAG: transglutaminase family protein [Pseudoxanthomonas sp.]